MGGEGVLPAGPSSGASLYHDLHQMMVVRDGLGVRVDRYLGAVCLANGMSGAVGSGIVAACSLIFFCLWAMMPRILVSAREQSLLRRVFAVLLSWRRAAELVSGVLCHFTSNKINARIDRCFNAKIGENAPKCARISRN